MKNNPLPWEVYEGGNFVKVVPPGFHAQLKKTGYFGGGVCDMDDWNGKDHVSSNGHARALSNARLIVAAVNSSGEAKQMALNLEKMLALFDRGHAMSRFDWGKSFLRAEDIRELNEKPISARKALEAWKASTKHL